MRAIWNPISDAGFRLWATSLRLTRSDRQKVFRGELVPQDPNDEPASALLARIRGERG